MLVTRQLSNYITPRPIKHPRLRLNDFPFSLQSLIQDVYCLPLASQRGDDALEHGPHSTWEGDHTSLQWGCVNTRTVQPHRAAQDASGQAVCAS